MQEKIPSGTRQGPGRRTRMIRIKGNKTQNMGVAYDLVMPMMALR